MSLGWLDNSRGPIYPMMIEDLQLSHSQGSAFFAVASFTAVLANFAVPYLMNFLVPKKLLMTGVVGLSLFPLLMSLTNTYIMLLASAIVFGAALGTILVTQNIVVEESVPPDSKRFFLSLLHSTFGLSALLAPLLIAVVLGQGVSWKNSLLYSLLFIGPVLLLGLFALKLNSVISVAKPSVKVLKQRLKIRYNKNQLAFWGLLLAFYVSSELFFTTRLVVLLKDISGVSIQVANMSLAYFFLGLFLGRIATSLTPKSFSGRGIIALSFVATVIWLLVSLYINISWIWLCGLLMAPIYPMAMDEISNHVGSDFRAYSSIIIALSSLGAVVMHMVVGYIFDAYGLKVALLLPIGLMASSVLMCLFLWPRKLNAVSINEVQTNN